MLTNELLENNILEVVFVKKNGDPRVMLATRRRDIVPTTINARTQSNPNILTVWDMEAAGWRSINKDTVTSVVINAV